MKMEIENVFGFEIRRIPNLIDHPQEKDDYLCDLISRIASKKPQLLGFYEKKLRGVNKNEELWALLGYIYYGKKDFQRAIKCFFKTIELNPKNIDNWIDLSFAYRAYGDIKISDWIFFNLNRIMINFIQKSYQKIDGNVLFDIMGKLKSTK